VSQAIADAARRIREWRGNAVKFAYDRFGFIPDSWQETFLGKLADPDVQRMALKACKGPGKTAVLAIAIWWFLQTQGEVGNHPKGAATAISKDNLKDNLWTELAAWRNRDEYTQRAFEWTKERIFARDHPETWYFSARAWAKSAKQDEQANTLAGLHAKYLMFVLDESGGIPDSVMVAADAGLSTYQAGHWIKILQAGNPTHLSGPLYRACTTEKHLWAAPHGLTIEITGDPDDPRRSSRISVKWAREQIEKYGRDNPWVLVNVFGKFPPASMNALLGPDDCSASMSRHWREDAYNWAAKILGVDVARFGDDRTVLFPRQGLAAFAPVVMRNARTNEIAARIAIAHQKWKPDAIFVDDTGGWGAGVIDACLLANLPVIGVNASGRSTNPRYFNKRSENYFDTAEWVKSGGALPNVPELTSELVAHTYWFHEGKMRLAEKDQVKQELNGHSPDYSDALALTFSMPIEPGRPVLVHPITGLPLASRNTTGDFDPYDENRTNSRLASTVSARSPQKRVFIPTRTFVLRKAA
jgi:phage terminase large subunit